MAPELGDQGQSSVYLPDRRSIAGTASSWTFLPAGIQSLLLQRIQPFAGAGTTSWSEATASQPMNDSPNKAVFLNGADTTRARNVEAGWLILAAGRPRSLSRRERLWAAAIAAKLHNAIRT